MANYTLWESDFNNTEDWETVCKAFKLPNNTTCIDIKVSSLITAERNAIVFNKEKKNESDLPSKSISRR
jgi:ferritin-like protein